jgi:heptosyltransferase-1/heptosyltransferase-2
VLLVRLHTLGDVLATLPFAQDLKKRYPNTDLQMLVCAPFAEIPRNMLVFSKVHTLAHARGGWRMGLDVLKMYPQLLRERFDVVVDFQKNRFSRLLRKALLPPAWSEFDRFSRRHAVLRYQATLEASGLGPADWQHRVALRDEEVGLHWLYQNGWDGRQRLVVLNPCGLFPTREWGADKYLAFAQKWLREVDPNTRFLLLGLPALQSKVAALEHELGPHCLNLIGKTSVLEAFNLVRHAALTLSDDGALLHTSWLNQVPTIGFLGSSPSYWGAPLGAWSVGFTSEDLPCGNCHSTTCRWGDNRCLARVTPEMALAQAKELLGI